MSFPIELQLLATCHNCDYRQRPFVPPYMRCEDGKTIHEHAEARDCPHGRYSDEALAAAQLQRLTDGEAKSRHWGSVLWERMHRSAITSAAPAFVMLIDEILAALPACGGCADGAKEWVGEHPLADRDRFEWTVDFHNYVNARLGRPIMCYAEARSLWGPQPFIIEHSEGMGDNVVFTGALRDLHAAYPDRFRTAIDAPPWLRDLYTHNPNVATLTPEEEKTAKRVRHYSYGDRWNDMQHLQFMHARGLSAALGVEVPVRRLGGDIHLSDEEKARPPIVPAPYWLVSCGHKAGWSVKMWPPEHFQRVVDHFKGRITFVQVGGVGDPHFRLNGVIDFLDRPLRELMPVMYHADGVLCPVSYLMHLAAAVPTAPGKPRVRAAVVIAGGRENPHFTTYSGQTQLGSIGKHDCCTGGGCWKTDVRDCAHPERVGGNFTVPRCMAQIAPERVIEEIEMRYDGYGLITAHEEKIARIVHRAKIADSMTSDGDLGFLAELAMRENARAALEIGSFHGCSACVLLYAGVKDLLCVDDFVGAHDVPGSTTYEGIATARENFGRTTAIAAADSGGSVRLFEFDSLGQAGPLRERLRGALGGDKLDLAWIDGNHSYEAVLADIETATTFLKPGGTVCGHDYHLIPGVKKAVDECFGRAVRTSGDVWFVTT